MTIDYDEGSTQNITMQRTLVLLKPDALQRGLVGEIIHRFERKGLKIVGLKMLKVSAAMLEEHYAHHKDKPFFASLKSFMMSSPLIGIVLEGKDAILVISKMAGKTNGREAEYGTIRGDFSISQSNNIVHASDSEEAAAEEIHRFFDEADLHDWDLSSSSFIYGEDEI